VDLCGGTGVTAAAILEAMPSHGRVISVDSSPAMQTVGRRARPDPRIQWICANAEEIPKYVTRPVDAVLCNAAIWKPTPRHVHAVVMFCVPVILVFNVGGGLRPEETTTRTDRRRSLLNDLITPSPPGTGTCRSGTAICQPSPRRCCERTRESGFTVRSAESPRTVAASKKRRHGCRSLFSDHQRTDTNSEWKSWKKPTAVDNPGRS
jgi:hypothetical protein